MDFLAVNHVLERMEGKVIGKIQAVVFRCVMVLKLHITVSSPPPPHVKEMMNQLK